jgi:hypothetical protein
MGETSMLFPTYPPQHVFIIADVRYVGRLVS